MSLDLCLPSNRKVGKGGVAIMWRSALSNNNSVLDIDSDRICGIQYRLCKNVNIYILQIYAPCSGNSIVFYREFVDYLQTLISLYSDNGTVVVMGDFNAHLQGQRFIKATNDRGKYMQAMFICYHNLVSVNTLPICTCATSTFVSYGDFYESLIDHILLPDTSIDMIQSCNQGA